MKQRMNDFNASRSDRRVAPACVIACESIATHPDFRALSDISALDVDLRYASVNNFLAHNFYGLLDCAYVHKTAGTALERAVSWLQEHTPDQRLRVLDALRPQRVQEQLFLALDGTPMAGYLAHPDHGSIHSFGMAVDVTLIDAAGCELDMGSAFDEMGFRSHTDDESTLVAQGVLTRQHVRNRKCLRDAMEHGGFQCLRTEWWHFDLGDRDAVRRDLPRVA
jgi:D-alanyl-D-alanine dipeptidase